MIDFDKKLKLRNQAKSININLNKEIPHVSSKKLINYWPFGIFSRNERIYITDWSKNGIYVYKNQLLEYKIRGKNLFSRIRDITMDSLDSILVTDLDRKSILIFDNKGVFINETKLPITNEKINNEEINIFGVCKIENTKFVFATQTSIYICNLGP